MDFSVGRFIKSNIVIFVVLSFPELKALLLSLL